jgi:hypothetical protein
MNAPTYDFWQNALAGKEQPVHENEPNVGFFYKRSKSGPRAPVAIWTDSVGNMLALVGFEGSAKLTDPAELWTWVCQNPVTEEAYRAAFASGQWPDDPPPARGSVLGDNLSGDPAEALEAELSGEEETTKEFLAKPVETQGQADKAAVWAKRLTEISKRAVDQHKAEKQPSLDAGRVVDHKWFPLRDRANSLAALLKQHVTPFLQAQKRAEEKRAREAAEEAARLRDEAARLAEEDDQRSVDRAEDLARQADVAEKASVPKNASAGRTGAKVSLRTEKRARIVDFDACLQALKTHPDLKALVEQLANRAVRAGVPLAGVEVEEITKAA